MLSDLLENDPVANQRRWRRSSRPVIRPGGTGWADDFIAACSLVEHEQGLRLYAEGSAGGREQIGLFTAESTDPARDVWTPCGDNPILRVGDGFDRGGVFDPAVVRWGDRWLMYYSATEGDAHAFAEAMEHSVAAEDAPADESIGLAVSRDGLSFTKHPEAPVLSSRCPFAVVDDQSVYLFHVRVTNGGYRIHVARSEDGVKFREEEHPALDVGRPGSWDAHTVTTPKVFRDGDLWCMAYAGDDQRLDDPSAIGLAFSDDLLNWERFAGNPVFTLGESGSFDSRSLQSPIIRRFGDRYYMWYAGSDRLIKDGLHSQVGLAWLEALP